MSLLALTLALAVQPAADLEAQARNALSIYGVGVGSPGPLYLQVHAGDLDGDGAADDAVLRLQCAGGALRSAHLGVISPRDAATGQASGKRTHKPVTFVKEWGAATPQLAASKPTYDLKKVEGSGARMASGADGWSTVSLANADGLCAAAQNAVKATRSRSNIQNN